MASRMPWFSDDLLLAIVYLVIIFCDYGILLSDTEIMAVLALSWNEPCWL